MTAAHNCKVGVVAGYMAFFDAIMPEGYQSEREAWAKHLIKPLELKEFEMIFPGLIVTRDDGIHAGEVFQKEGIDVLLVIPTMAAPPDYAWQAVKEFEGIPIIVWDAHVMKRIPSDYSMKDLVRHSSNVGTIMFTNVALRNGRNPQVFVGTYDDQEIHRKIIRTIRVGGLASRLKKGKIGIVGEPIDGYVNVLADESELKESIGLGMEVISEKEFLSVFQSISKEEIQSKRAWFETNGQIEKNIPEEELNKSIALATALERITDQHRLLGGAFNCRENFGVKNPDIGVIGCLGVSYMTTIGKPFTCTGDIITSIAMIISKNLGSSVLYCECDQIDYENDYMLMANTGESDFCLSCEKPCIISTGEHSGVLSRGASLFIRAKPGPATLVGLSPKKNAKGGWVLAIAAGEIMGTKHDELKVGNAAFRFENGPTADAFRRWCLAGASHHGALSTGNLTEELLLLGDLLKIETVVI